MRHICKPTRCDILGRCCCAVASSLRSLDASLWPTLRQNAKPRGPQVRSASIQTYDDALYVFCAGLPSAVPQMFITAVTSANTSTPPVRMQHTALLMISMSHQSEAASRDGEIHSGTSAQWVKTNGAPQLTNVGRIECTPVSWRSHYFAETQCFRTKGSATGGQSVGERGCPMCERVHICICVRG